MIEVSDAWVLLGNRIHQDFMEDYPDFISGIIYILEDFSAEQKSELHSFLINIKNASLSKSELGEIWVQSGAQIHFDTSKINLFYDELIKEVEEQIS